jgi:putative FmdB family regulatory protein
MPFFDYKCKKCQKVFEVLVKHNDDRPIVCECGSDEVEKQVSVKTSFKLKGTGWYQTDFKNK